ncbi:MAG: hypothetical protein IPQ07_06175 [Myxococcales bacterium]|nr:hypothetical protein [Myxococcales bacterium]
MAGEVLLDRPVIVGALGLGLVLDLAVVLVATLVATITILLGGRVAVAVIGAGVLGLLAVLVGLCRLT